MLCASEWRRLLSTLQTRCSCRWDWGAASCGAVRLQLALHQRLQQVRLCPAAQARQVPAVALILQGLYQVKPKLPFVPGSECSGTVVECGRDVRTVKVGDKVRMGAGQGHGMCADGGPEAGTLPACTSLIAFMPTGTARRSLLHAKLLVGPLLPNKQVCAVTQGGAFAEEVVVRENVVVKASC